MTSKTAQDSLRCLKMVPKMLQDATRPPQDGSKRPNSPSKEASNRPKSFKNLRKINDFCILAFSVLMGSSGLKTAPRWPQRGPRVGQERPKTAPRAPKGAPRVPQEGPKRRVFGWAPAVVNHWVDTHWGHLGPYWGHLGAILGPSWAILGHFGAIWGELGAILGPCWASLESRCYF